MKRDAFSFNKLELDDPINVLDKTTKKKKKKSPSEMKGIIK